MNLQQLITYLSAEILKHSDIEEVDHGSEFENDVEGKYAYPMCFIESSPAPRRKLPNGAIEYSLALQFLDRHKMADKIDALRAVARMEPVMDEVHAWLEERARQLPPEQKVFYKWDNAISLADATDTIAGGWRVEVTITVNGERCSWKSKFPAL